MARGLPGRDHPLLLRHDRRQALRDSDCVVLAGAPCDFRMDYGRHIRRAATVICANLSPKESRLNRRLDIAAIGDPGTFLESLAVRATQQSCQRSPWLDELRARDLKREKVIDGQAGHEGEWVNPVR